MIDDTHSAGVEIHQKRHEQADGEINRHRDGDHFDRLPGDIENAAGKDLNQVRITDGDRKRRVFEKIEILTGERRDDHPHRLRNDDQAKRRTEAQTERLSGFDLAMRHRLDTGAHHFSDERSRVNTQRNDQCGEFREDFNASADVEAADVQLAEPEWNAG
jgi:hypothetical protein